MKLQIKVFGPAKEIIGGNSLQIEFAGKTVGELRSQLISAYPDLAKLRSVIIAINETYVPEDSLVNPDDIVALIPPVSGG